VGTDSPQLDIPNVTGKAGTYWCEVTYDGTVHVSDKVVLQVATRPSIVQEPQDASKTVGERCDFSVVAEGGFPPLSYEWWKDDQKVSGATSNALSIAKAVTKDAGAYYVIVTDAEGTPVQSRTATLTVTGQQVPAAGFAALAALAGAFAVTGSRSSSRRKKQRA